MTFLALLKKRFRNTQQKLSTCRSWQSVEWLGMVSEALTPCFVLAAY